MLELLLVGAAWAQPVPCSAQLPAPDFGDAGGYRVLVLGVQAPGVDAEIGPEPLSVRLTRSLEEEVAGHYGRQAGLTLDHYRLRQIDCGLRAEQDAWAMIRAWDLDLVIYPGAGGLLVAAAPRQRAPSAELSRAQALYWLSPTPERFTLHLQNHAESEALPLLLVGLDLAQAGSVTSAQDYLDEAYELFFEKSPGSAARALALLAHAQLRAGQIDAARLTVSDMAQGCGSTPECLPIALEERALMAFASGDSALAIAAYERLLEHVQTGADPASIARARFALGRAKAWGGQLAAARTDLSAVLEAFMNLGDLRSAAICRVALAEERVASGEPEAASPQLSQALDAFRHLQDLIGEAWVHEVKASAFMGTGDLTLARKEADAAVAIAQKSESLHAQALALQRLAEVQVAQGDLPGAVATLERALFTIEAARDLVSAGPVQMEIGRLLSRSGQPDRAAVAWRRAAEMCATAGQTRCEVKALESLGMGALAQGDLKGAQASLEEAIERVKRLGDTRWEAELRRQIGDALEQAGERRAAMDQYKQALAVAQRAEDIQNQAELGERIGNTHAAFGEEPEALAAYGMAVPAWVQLGEMERAAALWLVMADICTDRKDPKAALDASGPLLDKLSTLDDPAVRTTVRQTAAKMCLLNQDPAGAGALYNQAAADAQAANDPTRRLDATLAAAEAYVSAGQSAAALQAYQAAVTLVSTGTLKTEKPRVRESLTNSALTGPEVDSLLKRL